jgi:hypothetical protein
MPKDTIRLFMMEMLKLYLLTISFTDHWITCLIRHDTGLSVQHNRDNEPGDDILVLTLEKIRKEFLELEEELKFLPSDQRDILLGVAVYNAICSPDAKQSMQRSLSSHRRRGFGSISRMIRCVSLSTNLPPVATQKMLRTQLSKDTD